MLYWCHLVYFLAKCYSFLSKLFDKYPNLDVTLPSERNVASPVQTKFLPAKNCLLRWKSVLIFTLIVLLLVFATHKCGLFPFLFLARASEFMSQLEMVIVIDKPLAQLFFVPSYWRPQCLTPHTCCCDKKTAASWFACSFQWPPH